MFRFRRRAIAIALLMVLPLVLAACSATGGKKAAQAAEGGGTAVAAGHANTKHYTVAVITHAAAGDTFWDVVKKGAEQAGKDLGVTVQYQSSGKPDEQADMVNTAVANKVAGIVVSMANPDALADPIKKAVAAGIPVITINSGASRSKEFGALAHVGQDETVAGQGAGSKLAQAGIRKLLCVKHEAANVGLDQR